MDAEIFKEKTILVYTKQSIVWAHDIFSVSICWTNQWMGKSQNSHDPPAHPTPKDLSESLEISWENLTKCPFNLPIPFGMLEWKTRETNCNKNWKSVLTGRICLTKRTKGRLKNSRIQPMSNKVKGLLGHTLDTAVRMNKLRQFSDLALPLKIEIPGEHLILA